MEIYAMAIEVFNRHENKYLIDADTYQKMQRHLSDYMDLDAYNTQQETYSVCNIYYDTDDNYLIRTSVSKPKYKEKLRLRSYGVPDGDSKVYVEIKKKFCGFVNKRRSSMQLDEAYAFLNTGELSATEPYMNRQVLSEVSYLMQQHALKPRLFLAYERRAFRGTGQHDLRISFDTAITTRRSDLRLESGIYGQKLLEEDKWLMEIKVAQSIPLWLTHLLSDYKIYPTSFSKYGTEYMNTIRKNVPQEKLSYMQPALHAGILLPA